LERDPGRAQRKSQVGYNEGVKTTGARPSGFGDALLTGTIRRELLSARLPAPGPALRALLPRLERLLAGVDGDAIDRDDRVPPRVIAGLKRLGVFRLRLPRAHGGLGCTHSDYHRVVEKIASKSAGLSMWVTTHQSLGAPGLLAVAGTAEQRAELLPRLAAGELSALAMTEEGAGTDPSLIATTARPVRGGYRLDGRKIWVTNGPVARWVVVLAKAPGGIACFVVDARSRGFSVERRGRFLGLRGMENGVLRLRGTFVPVSRRIGAEGDGLRLALTALNEGRLSVVPRALGITRECLRIARAWTAQRRQHGRRLSANPSVAERLERLETVVVQLAAVSARVAAWADEGRDLRTESALAKLFAASAAWEAADIALQLRGGRGYETADSQRARGERPEPAERLLRDARGLRVIEGTDDALRGALARRGLELGWGGTLNARAYVRADEAVRRFGEACVTRG
jgi:alkylation response protein AidB-like acyl-CoA dehydrogenase